MADDVTDSKTVFAAVAGASRMLGHVCAPSLIQRAVAQCCDIMPDLEAYDVNRNLLYNGLTEIGYKCAKPQGAFYLFVKAPGGDAMAFAEIAKKKNLLIVPSDSFGVPGYFRLSYCVSKEMIERSLPAFKEVFLEADMLNKKPAWPVAMRFFNIASISSSGSAAQNRPADGRRQGIRWGRWGQRGRGRNCGRSRPARPRG